MDLEGFRELGNDLYHRLHLPTYPVAIKFIKTEDEIPKENLYNSGCHAWGKSAIINTKIFPRSVIRIGTDLRQPVYLSR